MPRRPTCAWRTPFFCIHVCIVSSRAVAAASLSGKALTDPVAVHLAGLGDVVLRGYDCKPHLVARPTAIEFNEEQALFSLGGDLGRKFTCGRPYM